MPPRKPPDKARLRSASTAPASYYANRTRRPGFSFVPPLPWPSNPRIFRATLNVSDLDRGHFAEHGLTLARHPSETDERMMVRILAFALHADERLQFGRGISTDDEPALWLKDDSGRILRWIEVGLPDERLLRRASGKADEVIVLAYGGRAVDVLVAEGCRGAVAPAQTAMLALAQEDSRALAALAERNMEISCTIPGRADLVLVRRYHPQHHPPLPYFPNEGHRLFKISVLNLAQFGFSIECSS